MQEFPPPVAAEGDALPSSLRHQLIQLRSTAHGLTTAQARLAPLPSPLSIAGLLIHSAQVVHGWLTTIMRAPEPTPPEMYPEVSAGIGIHGMFPPDQFPEDASLAEILEVFDRVVAYIDDAADAIDLDVVLPENSPWQPGAVLTGRWVWLHLTTEVARHAGHADLIREALDGKTAADLGELAAKDPAGGVSTGGESTGSDG